MVGRAEHRRFHLDIRYKLRHVPFGVAVTCRRRRRLRSRCGISTHERQLMPRLCQDIKCVACTGGNPILIFLVVGNRILFPYVIFTLCQINLKHWVVIAFCLLQRRPEGFEGRVPRSTATRVVTRLGRYEVLQRHGLHPECHEACEEHRQQIPGW